MIDFFAFCHERELIRIKRAAGLPFPWTDDKILLSYRFTNINRDHDYGTVKMVKKIRASSEIRSSYESVIHFVMVYRLLGSPRWYVDTSESENLLTDRIKTGQSVMRMSAYQINVPKGMSAINLCLDSRLNDIAIAVVRLIDNMPVGKPTGMLSIRAIIASGIHEMGYNFTWFHGMEIAKDLALLFPKFVDPFSAVALGPGAIAGLKRIQVTSNLTGEELFYELQNESINNGFNLTLSNVEHALCEYNKYCEAKFEGKISRKYIS